MPISEIDGQQQVLLRLLLHLELFAARAVECGACITAGAGLVVASPKAATHHLKLQHAHGGGDLHSEPALQLHMGLLSSPNEFVCSAIPVSLHLGTISGC